MKSRVLILSAILICLIVGSSFFYYGRFIHQSNAATAKEQAYFDQCQNILKKAAILFPSYKGRIDCNNHLLETIPSDIQKMGWQYVQIPNTPFQLPLASDAGFVQTTDGGEDVYPLPANKRTDSSPYSFYLSFIECNEAGKWCDPKSFWVYANTQATWLDMDRKILLVLYSPNDNYLKYAFGVFSPAGYYIVEVHSLTKNGLPDSFLSNYKVTAASDIMRSIQVQLQSSVRNSSVGKQSSSSSISSTNLSFSSAHSDSTQQEIKQYTIPSTPFTISLPAGAELAKIRDPNAGTQQHPVPDESGAYIGAGQDTYYNNNQYFFSRWLGQSNEPSVDSYLQNVCKGVTKTVFSDRIGDYSGYTSLFDITTKDGIRVVKISPNCGNMAEYIVGYNGKVYRIGEGGEDGKFGTQIFDDALQNLKITK